MIYCNYRHDADYNEKEKKPTLVTDYNKRKPHVDLFNRETEKYAYRPATRRWPMRVFHWIIDCAAINAHVLHQQHTGASSRRMFLNELADKLMEQQQQIHVNEHWSNIRFRKIAESFDELRTKTMGGSHSKLIRCKSINDDGEICNKPSRQTQECNNCHKPACPEHYVELKLCHGCEQNMKIEEPAMLIETPTQRSTRNTPPQHPLSGKCHLCRSGEKITSKVFCRVCNKAMCAEHRSKTNPLFCLDCSL